jgi:hypothetical protein
VSVVSYAPRTGDGKTKTDGSRPVLPIPNRAYEALEAQHEAWGDCEYVFATEGKQIPRTVWRGG